MNEAGRASPAPAFPQTCRARLRSLAVIHREALQAITWTVAASPKFPAAEVMTGTSNPNFLRRVAQAHDGMAGVYGAVLVEGTLRKGDTVELLDERVV